MKTNPDTLHLSEINQLVHLSWRLEVIPQKPATFRLFHDAHLAFTGQLELINNNEVINTSDFHWQFRTKNNRIEQWCNQKKAHLSLGITYSFHAQSLVIEYIARHQVPTRLDLRHSIEEIAPPPEISFSEAKGANQVQRLQHRYHEQPSHYLSASGNQYFKEAFSATQWIML